MAKFRDRNRPSPIRRAAKLAKTALGAFSVPLAPTNSVFTHSCQRLKLKTLKPQAIARRIRVPLENWVEDPARVVRTLVELRVVFGQLCSGLYLGPVHPRSAFYNKPVIFWEWLECIDGSVFDPVRWLLTFTSPTVFFEPSCDYDLHGKRTRNNMLKTGQSAPPAHNPLCRAVSLPLSGDLSTKIAEVLLSVGPLDINQLAWLCNQPHELLGDHAAEFFQIVYLYGYGYLLSSRNKEFVSSNKRTDK